MSIFLPVAGICLSLITLTSIGASIGLLSGLFGVGGGFLLTPLLMFIGIPATVSAASGSCQMVATSSSGVAAHFRLGNVDAKMGSLLLFGGLVGAEFGVEAIKILRTLGDADQVIDLAYVLVLGVLGSYMFIQSLGTLRRGAIVKKSKKAPVGTGLLSRLPWQMDFPRSGVRHSILIPLFLSAIVGILASIMGVGGGFIMLPMMVYLLEMPTHVAIGTSLFQILFLCAGVTFMQAETNQTIDLVLVLPLALGSAMGAQLGARLGRLLRGEQLMILLAVLVLGVMGKMTTGLVLSPSNHLRPAEIYRREEVTEPSLNNRRAERERIDPEQGYGSGRLNTDPGSAPASTLDRHAGSAWIGVPHAPAVRGFVEWIGRSLQMCLADVPRRASGTEALWADPERRRGRLRRPLTYPSSFRWPEFATV